MTTVRRTIAVCVSGWLLLASAAVSQDNPYGRSQRGLLPDASVINDAQAAGDAAGISGCNVRRAVLLGRDNAGSPQYELSCRQGGGYIVLGAPQNRAYDCLGLERQIAARRAGNRDAPAVRRCSLPGNRSSRAPNSR